MEHRINDEVCAKPSAQAACTSRVYFNSNVDKAHARHHLDIPIWQGQGPSWDVITLHAACQRLPEPVLYLLTSARSSGGCSTPLCTPAGGSQGITVQDNRSRLACIASRCPAEPAAAAVACVAALPALQRTLQAAHTASGAFHRPARSLVSAASRRMLQPPDAPGAHLAHGARLLAVDKCLT